MISFARSSVSLVGAALPSPLQNSSASWARREGLLLTLYDKDGRAGLGEASPLPSYSPDILEDAQLALREIHQRLAPLDDALEAKEAVAKSLSGLGALPPSARFAIETALFDLLGQARGCSIAALLCEAPAKVISCNALLSLGEDDAALLQRAQRLVSLGYKTIKVKIGSNFPRELRQLQLLREALPRELSLRLDANGAWSIEAAREHLAALTSVSPSFVEQPVPIKALASLGRCEAPWAADESLQDRTEAEALLQTKTCSAFVLKPMALGGFLRSLELAQRASERGISVLVTHLFDGPVALSAACALACALPGNVLACGLDDHAGLSHWPEISIPYVLQSGARIARPHIGLGCEVQNA